jgi:hypothetical protein
LNENGKSQPHLYQTGDSGHFDFGGNIMLADAQPVTLKFAWVSWRQYALTSFPSM